MATSPISVSWIERPLIHGGGAQRPRRIVVHAMCAEIDYEGSRIDAAALLDRLKLSAHVLIQPDGTAIRCRRDDQVAWHAKGHNTDSLGVEVLVPWAYDLDGLKRVTAEKWVSTAQFGALASIITIWKRVHRIERIDRHSDLDPERRFFDPGQGFPWVELLQRTWGSL